MKKKRSTTTAICKGLNLKFIEDNNYKSQFDKFCSVRKGQSINKLAYLFIRSIGEYRVYKLFYRDHVLNGGSFSTIKSLLSIAKTNWIKDSKGNL